MSRFPLIRFALARLFANLAICALPISEGYCIDVGFGFADLLKIRANTIRVKGQEWRHSDHPDDNKEAAE